MFDILETHSPKKCSKASALAGLGVTMSDSLFQAGKKTLELRG